MNAQSLTAFHMISVSMSESGEIQENYRNLCAKTNMDSSTLERAWQTYRTTAQTLEEITEPEKNTEPKEAIEQGKTPEPEETSEPEEIAILTLGALENCTAITYEDAMEEAWCAFADADTIEEGGRDLNAAMSKIAQAREEPSTHREKAPSPKEEAIRVWNRFLTTQQQLARKHQGLTEAHQEDKDKARRGAAVTHRRRCGSNTLDELQNPREKEAHRPSEEPTKSREEEPEHREEPTSPRVKAPSPREEVIRVWDDPEAARQEAPGTHRGSPRGRGQGPLGGGSRGPEEVRQQHAR